MLKRISEPRRDAVTGKCGSFHNDDMNRLYFPGNTLTAIKSARTRLDVMRHTKLKEQDSSKISFRRVKNKQENRNN
jgi:hypothetical protein